MRKLLLFLLLLAVLLSCGMTALAVNEEREYHFELAVNGKDTIEVNTGDIITVTFYLNRTDSDNPYTMYAMQNEIRYDSTFFRLVEGSENISTGITATDIALRDQYREFYMNFLSLTGGQQWEARRLIGSFQLEVIASSGVTKITNEDYLVSSFDGTDRYSATATDVLVVISAECSVRFQTNGGTPIADLTANYGELISRPADPVREGYVLVGWYQDIDLQMPWDFEKDTVAGNMTLYAKWQKEDASVTEPGDTADTENFCWLWWVLIIILVLSVLYKINKERKKRKAAQQ